MTDSADDSSLSSEDRPPQALSRLEARIAQNEAHILTLRERVAEFDGAARRAKQRALWIRVFILLATLVAFFVVRSMKGGM